MTVTYHHESLTAEYVRRILDYDPDTGVFIWRSPTRYHPRLVGQQAGCDTTGYTLIRIDGRKYKAHRLAWLYVFWKWPAPILDHRDGNPFNNAIANLREATQAQNIANAARKAGKCLPKGVRHTRGRFTARISFQGQMHSVGTFGTADEAAQAYAAAARRFYGEFARAV
jgi:hypothetical protein